MVYVFGIDIPLMELLLVYSVVITYAVIMIFLEMRNLAKLIRIEKGDIQLIESKSSSPTDKFINTARKKGYSKREVRKILRKQGWENKEIDKLLIRY